jgi:hypothetical protein
MKLSEIAIIVIIIVLFITHLTYANIQRNKILFEIYKVQKVLKINVPGPVSKSEDPVSKSEVKDAINR